MELPTIDHRLIRAIGIHHPVEAVEQLRPCGSVPIADRCRRDPEGRGSRAGGRRPARRWSGPMRRPGRRRRGGEPGSAPNRLPRRSCGPDPVSSSCFSRPLILSAERLIQASMVSGRFHTIQAPTMTSDRAEHQDGDDHLDDVLAHELPLPRCPKIMRDAPPVMQVEHRSHSRAPRPRHNGRQPGNANRRHGRTGGRGLHQTTKRAAVVTAFGTPPPPGYTLPRSPPSPPDLRMRSVPARARRRERWEHRPNRCSPTSPSPCGSWSWADRDRPSRVRWTACGPG